MRVAIVALLAGCNGLLGLDPTLDRSLDSDEDGVGDDHDNCRGLFNPGQDDGNGNRVGDACDLCGARPLDCLDGSQPSGIDHNANCVDDACEDCTLLGPNDEDGDLVPDGCDLCPPISDASQLDIDADGVGDACDLGQAATQQRRLFDGFSTGLVLDDQKWIAGDWTIADGAAVAGNQPLEAKIRLAGGAITGDWSVLIGIELGLAGSTAIQVFAESEDVECAIVVNEQAPDVEFASLVAMGPSGSKVVPLNRNELVKPSQLRMVFEGSPDAGFRCELLDPPRTTDRLSAAFVGQPDLRVLFVSTVSSARLRYAFIVD